ncbi:MAG: M15 family metallopeptidase [Gaiellaceae bacterium]
MALNAARPAAPPPPFFAAISQPRWTDLRHSYRAGCPVRPSKLHLLAVPYWGFDRRVHHGSLVIHRRVSTQVAKVFQRLYAARFPIRRLRPVSAYRGSDDASMAADNTSAFNCRRVPGTQRWSMHAYGLAIDLNPVENPYVVGERFSPPAGRPYVDRTPYRPGMAVEGGVLVKAFESVGWKWGGRWTSSLDYQHFSTNGR